MCRSERIRPPRFDRNGWAASLCSFCGCPRPRPAGRTPPTKGPAPCSLPRMSRMRGGAQPRRSARHRHNRHRRFAEGGTDPTAALLTPRLGSFVAVETESIVCQIVCWRNKPARPAVTPAVSSDRYRSTLVSPS